MGGPNRINRITVEDYLMGASSSELRQEYIDGHVYSVAGGSANHNVISGNFFARIHEHLRGVPCRVFMLDMKARLLVDGMDIFYYPDIMVACDKRDTDPLFMRWPKLIIEVISQSTERVDKNEKLERYLTIPTLEEYVLVEQKRHAVTVYRRSQSWQPEIYAALDSLVSLESIGLTLPVAQLYENVILGEG